MVAQTITAAHRLRLVDLYAHADLLLNPHARQKLGHPDLLYWVFRPLEKKLMIMCIISAK